MTERTTERPDGLLAFWVGPGAVCCRCDRGLELRVELHTGGGVVRRSREGVLRVGKHRNKSYYYF